MKNGLSRGNFDDKIKPMKMAKSEFEDFFFRRIINRKNFTYRVLIPCLDTYVAEGDRVLDAGCGEGNLSMYMAKRGAFVFGVDKYTRYVDECEKKSINLALNHKTSFLRADIVKNKIKGTFDLVACFEVLEHIKNYIMAIRNLTNLMKPNGILIISTPSKNAPLFRLGLTKKEDKRFGHLRRYTLEEMDNLLKKQGLKILETRKTEGIFRNFLFYNQLGALPLRFANRFAIVSDIFTFFDNITLRLFGESQIIVVAQKPGKGEK